MWGTPMVTAVSTSTEDDLICKIFHKEFNNNTGNTLSDSNGGARDRSCRRSTSCRLSHQGQSLVVTSAAGPQTGRLLYITDRESRLCFTVDTGSEVGVIPPSKAELKNRLDTFGLLARTIRQL